MLTEDTYNMLLFTYLGKYPDKSERDFLIYEIQKCNEIEKLNKDPQKRLKYFKIKLERLPEEGDKKQKKSESLPFQIALLSELGFFEIDFFKNKSIESKYKVIAKLLSADERSVKGNIRVLNPQSEENRLKYTSNNYIKSVKKYLNTLK